MATKTVRPNSTVTAGGNSVVGAANAHTALSDDSDTSYMVLEYGKEQCILGIPDLGLPSGALIKAALVRIRCAGYNGTVIIQVGYTKDGLWTSQSISWKSMTTIVAAGDYNSHTEAEINGLNLRLQQAWPPGGVPVYVNEAYADVIYVPKPVVEVTGPSGTITDNTPVIEWDGELDWDGGAQTAYQVKVFDDAIYGGGGFNPSSSIPDYDSGEVSGAAQSLTLPLPLASIDTYKAYVRVGQTVHGTVLWSDWDAGSAFTVEASIPNPPVISITPEDEDARLSIEISEAKAGKSTADLYELQKSLDAGSTWMEVRTLEEGGMLPGGSSEAWDYEVPNGQDVRYRARSVNKAGNSTGPWVETADSSWSSPSVWIKNVFLPSLSLHNPEGGRVRSFPSQSRELDATVHKVLGRPDPIVVRDEGGPIYENGELVLMTETVEDREAVDALIESGQTLLLQFPEDADEQDRYIEITGSFQRERIVDKSFATLRDETFNWQQVAAPDGTVEEW